MSENIKVVEVNRNKNTEYVTYTKQINLEKIKEDLFIPDHIKDDFIDSEHWTEEDWREVDGDYFVNIVKVNDVVYVALNDFENDTPRYVSYSKDGGVFTSSYLPVVDLNDETYYAGDENLEIGKEEPFESVSTWLWNGGVSEVNHSEQLSLKGETLRYLLDV